ncbi:hypothetical protein HanRHA438_Chr15g0711681 [Helianthus annuus]|nr:hypothetical protein HanRHA438_Chr15g0711681 [Helianthus annuus]
MIVLSIMKYPNTFAIVIKQKGFAIEVQIKYFHDVIHHLYFSSNKSKSLSKGFDVFVEFRSLMKHDV